MAIRRLDIGHVLYTWVLTVRFDKKEQLINYTLTFPIAYNNNYIIVATVLIHLGNSMNVRVAQ